MNELKAFSQRFFFEFEKGELDEFKSISVDDRPLFENRIRQPSSLAIVEFYEDKEHIAVLSSTSSSSSSSSSSSTLLSLSSTKVTIEADDQVFFKQTVDIIEGKRIELNASIAQLKRDIDRKLRDQRKKKKKNGAIDNKVKVVRTVSHEIDEVDSEDIDI